MGSLRVLMAPHRTLEILRADSVVSVRWDARALEVPLDGQMRRVAWEGLEDGIEVEARWDDLELVLERKAGDVTVVERWSHAPGSSRLVVDVEVEGPLPRGAAMRRIYDRVRGESH